MKQKEIMPRFYSGDMYSKIILVISIVVSLFLKYYLFAGFMTAALLCSFFFSELSYRRGVKQMQNYLESASMRVGASESMPGFPFPAASITEKGKITWYNSALDKLLDGELLFQKDIRQFVKDFDSYTPDENGKYPVMKANLNNESFIVHAHKIPSQKDSVDIILVYFINSTKQEMFHEKYKNNKFVAMHVAFDNYEEVMQGLPDDARNAIQSSVDRALASMTAENNGIFVKTERDRYSIFVSSGSLRALINKKFNILDTVREIQHENTISPTLSIGIGADGNSFLENDNFARTALDMALGRGGDQVVLKDKNSMQYFGGRTREVEKRTKVKARVVAYALKELISQCENVIVVGHKNADIDCIGAAMGIHAIARQYSKKAYIIHHEYDDTASCVVAKACTEPDYEGVFIKKNLVKDVLSSKSLICIVDTNSPSYMENVDIFGLSEQIVLIDHHRKSSDFIKNPSVAYHEPYASSTCEMITEMLPYLHNKNFLLKVEAEALYAGIYLDTKGFAFKTGVRTLEAAAYLRRAGVDPISVKQYFKSDLLTFTMKAALIQSTVVYHEHIAISVSEEERSSSLIAQAADELLNIKNIDTSFVIAKREAYCIISGRSTGAINVQVVLEKLGGGGHFSVAGAQLKDVTPLEAKEKLLQAVEEYLAEN